jgi:cytochrome c6
MRINLRAIVWTLALLLPALVACGQAITTPPAVNVAVIEPAFGSQLASGQELFGTYCAGCHGQSGEGLGPFPALNNGLHAYKHPDWELIALIKDGKNAMPGFNGKLSDEQIIDIIARVKAWWGPGQLSEQRELCVLSPGPTPTPQ